MTANIRAWWPMVWCEIGQAHSNFRSDPLVDDDWNRTPCKPNQLFCFFLLFFHIVSRFIVIATSFFLEWYEYLTISQHHTLILFQMTLLNVSLLFAAQQNVLSVSMIRNWISDTRLRVWIRCTLYVYHGFIALSPTTANYKLATACQFLIISEPNRPDDYLLTTYFCGRYWENW